MKMLLTRVAAVAAIGAAAGIGAGTFADQATVQVQPVVFAAPLPLQPASGEPVPTPDQVAGMLTKLTDPGISYKEKGNLVENGIDQQEGHGLDHDLRKAYRDGEMPYTFDVVSVSPTDPDHAIATVTISGPKKAPQTTPLTLVDQGGWVLTHDSATALMQMLAGH